MNEADIKITISGDASTAKRAAAEADAAFRGAAKSIKASGDTMAGATDKAAGGATRAAKAFGPLGGILARLDPTAGALSSSIAAATTAAEGFAAAGISVVGVLGPIGVALAGAAAVWYTLNQEAAQTAKELDAATASVKRWQAATASATTSTEEINRQFRIASGQMAQWEADAEDRVTAYKKERKGADDLLEKTIDVLAVRSASGKITADEQERLHFLRGEQSAYRAETDDTITTIELLAEKKALDDAVTKAVTKSTDKLTKAQRALKAAAEDTIAALAEGQADRDTSAALHADEDRLKLQRRLQKGAERLAEIEADAAKQAQEAIDAEAKARQDAIDKRREGVASVGDAYADLGAAIKDEGAAGFAIWKAAALAQTVINTAQGITKAYADLPIFAAVPASIAIGGIGAVQAAKIAGEQPSFDDTPGVMQAKGGRTSVSFKDGDHFAAAQNPADLAAQVGGGGVTVFQLEHRFFYRTIRDGFRAPTSLTKGVSALSSRVPGRRA